VWRSIEFTPPLPDWKSSALDSVQYAHAAKLAIELPAAVEASATLAVPDYYWTWTATRAHATTDPVLNCFAGSTRVLKILDIDNGQDTWFERVQKLHPDLTLKPENALLSTWDDDPWVHAAYSTRTPTGTHNAATLQEPVGPLHFAGEHTAAEHFALMEGAVRSGQRAASELAS
jgi:monoamine oxidase